MDNEQLFFDQLAPQWDDIRLLDPAKIEHLVSMIGFCQGDRILDTGCGTGVLIPFAREVIGNTGHITAVDFSPKMIEQAVHKHKGITGIDFVACDIMDYMSESRFDKIICFNFFPHVADKQAFLKKMGDMLVAEGVLVIMHDISRDTVNGIHKGSDAVKNDRLPEGEKTAGILVSLGYKVEDIIDNDELYFIKARFK